MPSLLLSSPDADEKPTKTKKLAYMAAAAEPISPVAEEAMKSKKRNKHQTLDSNSGYVEIAGEGDVSSDKKNKEKKDNKEKKSKKRKLKDSDDEKSSPSSEASPAPAPAPAPAPPAKKAKPVASDDDGELTTSGEEEERPNAVSKFRISKVLRDRLKSKGIESLFPIQAMTFDLILDGSDLVGRARTGQGKTLAFVLPILESLMNGQSKVSRKTGHGRPPSVLVLLPTRELANQVHDDFKFYGGAFGLSSCCLIGGASSYDQRCALENGADIVIGTPGRIKDHLENGKLNLRSLKFRVLDEADEMLNMGFVDNVELILGKVEDVNKVQTLLFSATLPDWVKKISTRFLKADKKTVDLVGNEKLKASASVKHLVLPCNRAARAQIIPDIIRCYSHGGRTIIFTETRESTTELARLIPGSRAFNGDIIQRQRDELLDKFRKGRFLILVATNVAARGLDISDVQLIIQCEPPRDVEAYIHRSGRTGRAGNTGVAILLYEPRYSHGVARIERESGVKFEHISAPQPSDVAESAGSEAAESISNVSDSVVPVFRQQAEQLLNSSGLTPVDLLAKALAKAAGYTAMKKRSLFSSMENFVTLILQAGKPMYTPSFAFTILRRFMPDEKIGDVKGMTLTADGTGAVFDVPADDVDAFLQGQENANMVTIEVLKTLPPLQERDQSRGNSGRRIGGGNRGSSFSGSGGGRRGSGFSGRGKSQGRQGRGGSRFGKRN